MSVTPDALLETPLAERHRAAGARMVPFAGYAMPVQYPDGVLAEHRWTRAHAGLFDVSHMGQAWLRGADSFAALERVTPSDLVSLGVGRQKYTLLLDDAGGVLDDMMVARPDAGGDLFMVVNASTKAADFAYIAGRLGEAAPLVPLPKRALVALQGPEAFGVFARLVPQAAGMVFMDSRRIEETAWGELIVSRSGYTGEDGVEVSVAADQAGALWDALLAHPDVRPIGLGARDSLRLEAGLPLYGHDLDATTSPVEGALTFAVAKRRRQAADFPGAERVLRELADGPSRVRVGLRSLGAPAREGAEIVDPAGQPLGRVTSGGPSPSGVGNVAMGYVPPAYAAPGTAVQLLVRGRALAAEVVPMPFIPHRYVRKV